MGSPRRSSSRCTASGSAVFAWLLHRLQSWARAPVVLAQLIQLGVAWSFRGGGDTAVVVGAAAVVAVVVLAGHASTRRRCARSPRTDGPDGPSCVLAA